MGLVGVIHGGESGPELMLPALSRLSAMTLIFLDI